MKINPKIFRAYDIRGVFPKEINEENAYFIGRAFVKFLKKKNPKIVVGRDNRLSSPVLYRGLSQGILDEGAHIIDIGLATTPMFYFAVAYFRYDGGIQITASHNPPEYNGFKLVRKKAKPMSRDRGLRKIQELAEKTSKIFLKKRGKIEKKNIANDYLKFNLKDFNLKNLQPLRVVVDTANAVSGILIKKLKERLPLEIFHLFEKLDGSFPNHSPDPLKKENLVFLQKEVKKRKAHFGVAFDGDGDRICFVDERGKIVSGDIITALLAKEILRKNPGEKILYDVRSSNIVPEIIEKSGGIPIVSRIGHSFIKEKMRKEKIVFGGEFSGHYYHRDHYFCEAPLFVFFEVIKIISQQKNTFSKIIKPYQKYFQSGEINFEVKEKERVLKFLEEKFAKKGKVLKIDGLRVDFPNWWFLARPSGTEDLLRLSIEAKRKKLMEEKKRELISLIKN